MGDVAIIAMYATPGTGVVAFGCAYNPAGRPLHMAVSPELAPDVLQRAVDFFEWLQSHPVENPVYTRSSDGERVTVAVPVADHAGFEILPDHAMVVTLTPEIDAETWLRHAFIRARHTTLDAQSAVSPGEFDGIA